VKFLDDGEKKIDLVKSTAQSKAADIDAVFRALDEIKATMRAKRLELDKLVKARKESIKIEIMQVGKDELAKHIASLNKRLAKVQMPLIPADFATAIKGKRNLAAMRGAVADLVAAKKIESNEIADLVQLNLTDFQLHSDYAFLFPDINALVLKKPDDFAAAIMLRINNHKESEAKRLDAEREKIRAEEEAKATAKAKAEQEAATKIVSDRAHDAIMEEHRTLAAARATQPAAQTAPVHIGVDMASGPSQTVYHTGNANAKLRGQIDTALDQCTYPELQQIAGFIIRLAGERSIAA
jgi:hypothetical protein